MSLLQNVICPVSNVKIDSYTSRTTVFLNVILLALYVFTGSPLFILIVALDYGIRAAWKPAYSPLGWVAKRLVRAVGLPQKLVDQAPKLFASRVGFLFAGVSALLLPVSAPASIVVATVLLVFALLDSVFDFCVGCITYTYLVLPFFQRRQGTVGW